MRSHVSPNRMTASREARLPLRIPVAARGSTGGRWQSPACTLGLDIALLGEGVKA